MTRQVTHPLPPHVLPWLSFGRFIVTNFTLGRYQGELEALRQRILQAKTDPSVVDVGGSLGTP